MEDQDSSSGADISLGKREAFYEVVCRYTDCEVSGQISTRMIRATNTPIPVTEIARRFDFSSGV